jgi:hypothetical protein
MATKTKRTKSKYLSRKQFNYLLSAGLGLVRIRDSKMITVDFVKVLELNKIKFPIKIPAQKPTNT